MPENNIKSVDLSLRIMEYLQNNDGAPIKDLVEGFDVSLSTAHRHLNTLETHGYVVQEGDQYYVGLRVLEMAHHATNRKPTYDIAEDITEVLADETGDRVSFITEENGKGIILATEIGEHGIFADVKIGQRIPLHASAVGKAILANYARDYIDRILDRHDLPKHTQNTITDRDTLYSELDEINERGFAINYSERIDGVRAVGVAVEESDGTIIGSFGVSAPTRRMSEERISNEISDSLLSAAEEFELRNRYSETT